VKFVTTPLTTQAQHQKRELHPAFVTLATQRTQITSWSKVQDPLALRPTFITPAINNTAKAFQARAALPAQSEELSDDR
jgi:hypothetical protein